MVTWYLRQGLTESATWTAARASSGSGEESDLLAAGRLRDLFRGYTLKAMVFTAVVYMFWNLAAGTYGFFLPFFLRGARGERPGRQRCPAMPVVHHHARLRRAGVHAVR